MRGVDQRPLRVDVGRLDLGPAPERAQPLGEPVRGPALGVGAGEPALERAQLANQSPCAAAVHGRGIIAMRRVGFEPTCPEGQRLLRPPCKPVAPPPRARHSDDPAARMRRVESHRASLDRMCGRYTLTNPDPRRLRPRFDILESADVDERAALQHRADRPGARGPAARGRRPRARPAALGPGAGPLGREGVGPAADQRARRDARRASRRFASRFASGAA